MVFENIEQLKRQWTDKYVVADDGRPELRRFKGQTGTVKTVNMNGRALVEFDGHNNIGWYDIDLSFLKIIDAPLPKPDAKSGAKPDKGLSKPEKTPIKAGAEAKPAAEKAATAKPAAGKQSAADILAAARANKPAAAPPAKSEPATPGKPAGAADPKKMSAADVLAAARGNKPTGSPAAKGESATAPASKSEPSPAAPKPAAPAADPKKMSTADILAAARAGTAKASPKAAAPAAAPAPAKAPPLPEPEPEPEPAEAVSLPTQSTSAGGKRSKRDEIKGYDEMIAYCRRVDAR